MEDGPQQIVGIGFLVRADILVEIIEAGDRRQPRAVIGELEFLAELVLVDADEDVADFELGRVDVDIIAVSSLRYAVIDFNVSASVRS